MEKVKSKRIDFDLFRNKLRYLTGTITILDQKYDGKGIDISESKDKSVLAIIDGEDATIYAEGGVLCPDIEDMDGLFEHFCAKTLNLKGLDTSLVVDMSYMFFGSKAQKIDLSNFNTIHVKEMCFMFASSKAKVLDLSSFDLSSASDTFCIFDSSKAKKIICKTQEDVERIKNSIGCPKAEIIVKA